MVKGPPITQVNFVLLSPHLLHGVQHCFAHGTKSSAMAMTSMFRKSCRTLAVGITLTAGFIAAPARADDASGCQNPPAARTLDTKWPINIGRLAQQLIVYRCTDYMKDVAGAVAQARAWVQQRAAEVDNPAVVFDIDETSLSNWEIIYHNNFAYLANGACDLSSPNPCGWRDWDLSARAVALQPTLDFFRLVKSLNARNGGKVAIFFITGRYEDPSERVATEWNLRKEGYDTWERLYLRPSSTKGDPVSKYKTDSRKEIEKKYKIIANLGDQYSDLIGDLDDDHAEQCFKISNPFYFIPPGLPLAGLKCLLH
jgi:predicted secreted acid phosphatase